MQYQRVAALAAVLLLASLATGQNAKKTLAAPADQPATQLANQLARRMADDLHVKTVVGQPMKVGSVTLIPIMMIDVTFGGAGMATPASPDAKAEGSPPVDGFYTSGEARPLGFVAITGKGIRFISVGKTPAK